MIKVTDAVQSIIKGDEVALEALRFGILNLSAYAAKIHPTVETVALKSIKRGTIVVALSRLIKRLEPVASLKPHVIIDDISIKSPLCELTYEKTEDVLRSAATLQILSQTKNDFFTMTQGLGELTIICTQAAREGIITHLKTAMKAQYNHLVSVTVRFSEKNYIEVPNVIYVFVSALAARRINIIEIVSTYTELSFIVKRQDMERTLAALDSYFQKSTP
ncbi:hypothetical protein HY409_03250 [Candidatus Gottesmanbacteria bacterium]|nr:hypothetical protein [Candidatus Gottesmanbacteria bacterium]